MNLIDALKTGKRIRRKDSSTWLDHDEIPFWIRVTDFSCIIAEDWEVEPEAPAFSLQDCLSVLDKREGILAISDSLRNSIVHHLKTVGTSCSRSSKKEDVPKSIVCGVEKY